MIKNIQTVTKATWNSAVKAITLLTILILLLAANGLNANVDTTAAQEPIRVNVWGVKADIIDVSLFEQPVSQPTVLDSHPIQGDEVHQPITFDPEPYDKEILRHNTVSNWVIESDTVDVSPVEQPFGAKNVAGEQEMGNNWIEEFYRDYNNMRTLEARANIRRYWK